jgi:hypothetical protein
MCTEGSSRSMLRLLAAGLLCASFPGCDRGAGARRGESDAPGAEASAVERGDVGPVMSSVPEWPEGTGWRIEDRPLLRFGGIDDAGGVTIGNLQAAFVLDGGSLVIADDRSSTLSWVDPSGRLIRTVGRTGEGPGEFRFLNAVDRTAGDTIVAVDVQLSRITVISPTGETVRTEPLDRTAWRSWSRDEARGVRAHVRTSLDDQTIVGVTSTTFHDTQVGVTEDSVWIVLDPPGSSAATTFGPLPGSELWRSAGRIRGLPLGRHFVFATDGSEVYVSTGKPATIEVFSRAGRLVRAFGIDRPLREVNDALIESTKAQAVAVMVASQRERTARTLEEITYPDEVPAFVGIVVDAGGNVWAEEYRTTPGPSVYEVFDPDGGWLGRVTAPDNIRILQVGSDFVLAQRTDENYVDEVLLYRLLRSN